MKLATLLCLFAVASADNAPAADASAASDAGYESAPEAYDAAPVAYAKAPEVCLGSCPKDAPCQHASGACMPKSCYQGGYEGGYAVEGAYDGGYATEAAPATAAEGGRRLQGGYAGETYAAPVQTYAPPRRCGCPAGTKDVHGFSRLNKRATLWVAFALLLGPALYFFSQAWERDSSGSPSDETRMHRVVAGGICFIASLAYLVMALGHGYIVRCCDGREFYYARYVDWAITTPMMIWELVNLNCSVVKGSDKMFMYTVDFLMIISGLIGALICKDHKWAFFGFSILCFVPLLWFMCNLRSNDASNKTYNQIATITVITWFFYPIVWIFAEGTDKLSAQGEAICYTVLDIISKSVFGWIIVQSNFTRGGSPPPVVANGSSML